MLVADRERARQQGALAPLHGVFLVALLASLGEPGAQQGEASVDKRPQLRPDHRHHQTLVHHRQADVQCSTSEVWGSVPIPERHSPGETPAQSLKAR